ncbi:MAG: hypothetical protein R3D71_10525 [Rickettsiales bacterium]
MRYLELSVENQVIDNKTKRTTILTDSETAKKIEIFYEFDREVLWSKRSPVDANVLAVLLHAAEQGKDLRVNGIMSAKAIRNMEELLLAWNCWKPDLYKKIDIIPNEVINIHKSGDKQKAITLFSGGVDAIFNILNNKDSKIPEYKRYDVNTALMVHGFDIDIYNHKDFTKLMKRTSPLLDELSIDLRTIRTNSRELRMQKWDDSHGLELAACLLMYGDEFDFGLIGSSDPYDEFLLPWGSSPVTDFMMSNNMMEIIHYGAGFSRTEKVAKIAQNNTASEVLKVCWAGGDQSGNCGCCEKCTRTRLNFLATGMIETPACFSGDINIKNVEGMDIKTEGKLSEIKSIASYAREHGVRGDWLELIERRIEQWEPSAELLEKRSQIRKYAEKPEKKTLKQKIADLISCMGFSDTIKKIWRKARRGVLTHMF